MSHKNAQYPLILNQAEGCKHVHLFSEVVARWSLQPNMLLGSYSNHDPLQIKSLVKIKNPTL